MYQHCYFRIEANYTSLNKERVNYLFDEIVELFNQKGWKTLHDYGMEDVLKYKKEKVFYMFIRKHYREMLMWI